MTKDYAGRGRPQRKTSGGRRSSSAKKSKLPVLITLVLLGGMAYFLYGIRGAGNEMNVSPPIAAEPTPVPVKPVTPPKPLPEKPQQNWDYQTLLPNSEVEVEVAQQQSGGPYQMQCASFRQESDAHSMKAHMAFQGLISEVRRTEGSNGVWFRVVLGPYERRRAAEKDRHILQRMGINTCQIWNWT